MLALLLALAAVCSVARNSDGQIARSRDVARSFRHQHPCPGGPDKGSRTRCRGYVADHVVPLCAGGKDAPENMAWQTRKDAAAKDRAEVALCRWIAIECGKPWRKHR
jgi:hypothetical protein